MKRLFAEATALGGSLWSWLALKVWVLPVITAAYYGVATVILVLDYLEKRRKHNYQDEAQDTRKKAD